MPKRSHKDFADADANGAGSGAQKRNKPDKAASNQTDALAALLENADELIDCVTALKAQRKQGQLTSHSLSHGTRKSLSRLSRNLSSALPLLGDTVQGESQDDSVRQEPSAAADPAAKLPASASIPACFTAWASSEIPEDTPPLPSVLDPALEAAALNHSGTNSRADVENYERLEWVGDAYIYLISSRLVFHTFRSQTAGRCSQLRELLVRNSTLAGYSVRYDFHKKAKLPPEFEANGREKGTRASDSTFEKTMGDLFEAYVGAVILSDPEHGFVRVSAWLKDLWGQTLKERISKEERAAAAGTEPPAKTLLAKEIMVPGVRLRYEDIESKKKKDKDQKKLQLFSVGVFLDGWGEKDKKLGWGSALSKSEAGQKAARMALDNKKMIKTYSTKKKEFLAAQGK